MNYDFLLFFSPISLESPTKMINSGLSKVSESKKKKNSLSSFCSCSYNLESILCYIYSIEARSHEAHPFSIYYVILFDTLM